MSDPDQVLNDARTGWQLASAENEMLRDHLQRERAAASERLDHLKATSAELTKVRAEAVAREALLLKNGALLDELHEALRFRDLQISELTAQLATVRTTLRETQTNASRASEENALLRERIEVERKAAAERLEQLEAASAELHRQIDQATQRSSLIEQLTAMVADQHRTIEDLRGARPDR